MNFKFKLSSTIPIVYCLIFIGIIFLSSSSLSEAQSTFNDKYYFIKKQLLWVSLGTILLYIATRINLNKLKRFVPILYWISVFGLALVLIPKVGDTIFGARRWLSLGYFAIQPTEFFKITAILYFSSLFANPAQRNLKNILTRLVPPLILIIAEPNMSSAVLITAIVFSLYYLSGGEIIQMFSLGIVALVVSLLLIFISPYRSARLTTLLNPQQNNTSTSYHTNQIILSLASGGLFGKGLANSSQKYNYLPQLATDSIMAVIGEEIGFVGLASIIAAYVILFLNIMKTAKNIPDQFQRMVISGVGCWIALQALINLGAISAIIPLTGIPLPFISYGGSSLLTLLFAIGLINYHAI